MSISSKHTIEQWLSWEALGRIEITNVSTEF